ncbi:hypothetical protein MP228_010149 [Amoeboaphelidium protococcarum]|nr:hypothetical protein MP228_010149 [Amoeboaphelidium protococcarum]
MKFLAFGISLLLSTNVRVNAYNILSEDPAFLETTCQNNIAQCDTFCKPEGTVKNVCDSSSMQWECVCKGNQVPPDTKITFPVAYEICSGNYKECAAKCVSDQACQDRCGQQFKCDNITPTSNSTSPADVPSPSSSTKKKSPSPEDYQNAATALSVAYLSAAVMPILAIL